MKKLPNVIFVRTYKESNGDEWLSVSYTPLDCIEDDGPTVVGTYKLVGTRKLRKIIVEDKTK